MVYDTAISSLLLLVLAALGTGEVPVAPATAPPFWNIDRKACMRIAMASVDVKFPEACGNAPRKTSEPSAEPVEGIPVAVELRGRRSESAFFRYPVREGPVLGDLNFEVLTPPLSDDDDDADGDFDDLLPVLEVAVVLDPQLSSLPLRLGSPASLSV